MFMKKEGIFMSKQRFTVAIIGVGGRGGMPTESGFRGFLKSLKLLRFAIFQGRS